MKKNLENTASITLVTVILLVSNLVYASEQNLCKEIEGLWVMTQMNPVHPQSSNPMGVINSRWFFDTKKSLVYTSQPDTVGGMVADESKGIKYDCDVNIIDLNIQAKSTYTPYSTITSIQSITTSQLILNIETSSDLFGTNTTEQIYTRNHFKSDGDRFEPVSIQVLQYENNDLGILDLEYDDEDYSDQPLKERILGVWEVNRYKNFPRQEMPPYGHLNDVYTIKKNNICIRKRYPPEQSVCYQYILNGNLLTWIMDSSQYSDTISFNEWGHLELDNKVTVQSLKLITKDVTAKPQLPLKVVLTSLLKNKERNGK